MKKTKKTVRKNYNLGFKPNGFSFNSKKMCYEYNIQAFDSTTFSKNSLGLFKIDVKIDMIDNKRVINMELFKEFLLSTYSISLTNKDIITNHFERDGFPFPCIQYIVLTPEQYIRSQRKIKIKELKKSI